MAVAFPTNWSFVAVSVAVVSIATGQVGHSVEPVSARQRATQILDATGVQGGLVVHLGCGDGKLTARLRAGDSYIVQGLDTDPSSVAAARKTITAQGLYGKVTIDRFDGKQLPYIDNLVNLVVAEDLGDVSMAEVNRVLAPDGVAYIQNEGKWKKTVKPRPKDMDDWPLYSHDPQGTMTGRDKIVGLPRRMQWVGGPKWLRNHDFMSSLNGLVSSGGRIFYIIDEGLRSHIYMPGRWTVVAQDAFNGTLLWKRPIDEWFPHTFPFKSGPGYLPRRIVTDGDRVYVTLGIRAPLAALDAATGETIRTYEGTRSTEEIVLSDGVLYLVVEPDKKPFPYKHASSNRGAERNRVNTEFGWSKESPPRMLMAVSADTGKVLWKAEHRIAPLTLAVQGNRLYYHDGEHIVSLNRRDGRQAWISEDAGDWATPTTGYASRLIVGDGVVVLSSQKGKGGRLTGVSTDDGKILWKSEQLRSGHFSPEDLFLIDGLVWTANTGGSQSQGTHFQAIDAKTGEMKQDFVAKQIEAYFMHQRCYPGRATERFIMASGTGTEFLEVGTQQCDIHHWLRGSCIYGIMPCNGLLYKPPDSCACYYQSKLPNFCAIAPASKAESRKRKTGRPRLEKGPAYGKITNPKSKIRNQDWPAYRHDSARSGHSPQNVAAKVKKIWQTDLGGKLSTMTAADGRLFVAQIDEHTLHALDARSGKRVWSYTAGGRIDSPPTIVDGKALFGCADGWVYCLRTSDGQLAWRFRAAPTNARLVSYDQVESVWPVSGSVLIHDGVAYCLAGRNLFLDGGMHLVRLDCTTGKLLSETVLDDKDPRTGKNLQTLMAGKAIPVANADLFSCDGEHIYMGSEKFDLEGKRVELDLVRGKERNQAGEGRHLFCPTGFLDDAWFHRSYFIYGKNAGEGHGEYTAPRNRTPAGRIMVFDDTKAYGFIAANVGNNINPRTSYTLYAAQKDAAAANEPPVAKAATKERGKRKKKKVAPKTKSKGISRLWELPKPGLQTNAMVLAGDNLFMAGPPDVADEEQTFGYVFGGNDEIHRQMEQQEQAWLGKKGALLWVVSADSGEKLAECKIPAIPVWDGMIATGGRLYLSLKDGTVLCLGAHIPLNAESKAGGKR